MKTIIEPFRTKTVEAIRFSTQAEREKLLSNAGFNLFQIRASDVMVDLLTDSGTSAMSSEQWSAMMRGDESYAGCQSFYRFIDAVQNIFGFKEVLPVHQGRAGERILFTNLVKPGDVIPSNTHFDTTRANIEALQAVAMDCPCKESIDHESSFPFKGNIDLDSVNELINSKANVPFAMLTVTNNACGGQPVAMSNIKAYCALMRKHGVPIYIDAARFAENAYLIKTQEPGYENKTVAEIAREIFDLADGCLMSAKKDGLANMGGFIALNDTKLAAGLKKDLIRTEGFPTYGGLSGRDLETIAVGLQEVLSEDYQRYRHASANYMARGLLDAGVPIMLPHALHAVYIDAARFLPHIPAHQFPGQVVVCELYREGGVRSCEIGTAMFGKTDPKTGKEIPAMNELVRLALPRRVYSQSHFDFVIEAAKNVYERRNSLSGMRIVWQPEALRHFTAEFAYLDENGSNPSGKEALACH